MNKNSGFTLIELLVAVAILALLATAAITTFTGTNQRKQLDVITRQLVSDLQYVQQKNINGFSAYQLIITPQLSQYSVSPDGINLEKTVAFPQNVSSPTALTISFANNGGITPGLTITFSRGSNNKFVIIDTVGRIRIDTTAP